MKGWLLHQRRERARAAPNAVYRAGFQHRHAALKASSTWRGGMSGECCICIGSITEPGDSAASASGVPDYPVATKCGHLFHHSCLSTWLKQKSVCPSCKETVRKTTCVLFPLCR